MNTRGTRRGFCLGLAVVATVGGACVSSSGQTVEGQLRIVKRLPIRQAADIAWSRDGRYLAVDRWTTGGYGAWDMVAGRMVRELAGEFAQVGGGRELVFAPDSKHVVVSPPRHPKVMTEAGLPELALWNVETGAIDATIAGVAGRGGIGTVGEDTFTVSTASERMAILFLDDRIVVYDTRTWQLITTIQGEPRTGSIALSPSGHLVAVGGSDGIVGVIWIYDAATGTLLNTIERAHNNLVRSISFVGDDRLASTTFERLKPDPDPVRVWDVRTGAKIASFVEVFDNGDVLASPDGRLLALVTFLAETRSTPPSVLVVWDVDTGRRIGSLRANQRTAFRSIAFGPDSRSIAMNHWRDGDPIEVLIVEVDPERRN